MCLTEYLKQNLPVTPKCQGKRHIERMQANALISDHYVEKIKAKQLKKAEEEAAKEERKRLREEKNKENEKVPKKKINKKCDDKSKIKKSKEDRSKVKTKNRSNLNEQLVFCDFCSNVITRRVIL